MIDELKPCPFCGSPATLDEQDDWWIGCTNDDGRGECDFVPSGWFEDKDDAIEVWNTRANEDAKE
jgi:hypothetical protein